MFDLLLRVAVSAVCFVLATYSLGHGSITGPTIWFLIGMACGGAANNERMRLDQKNAQLSAKQVSFLEGVILAIFAVAVPKYISLWATDVSGWEKTLLVAIPICLLLLLMVPFKAMKA